MKSLFTKGSLRKASLLLCFAGLASCSAKGNVEDPFTFTVLSPTGAPSLAFYDLGEDPSWVSTSSPAAFIPTSFATSAYDAIVFDGITGLSLIQSNQRPYRLAAWINEGSFYLVSSKYDMECLSTPFSSLPSIDAFMENGTASKVFRDLAKNSLQWGDYGSEEAKANAIVYESGVWSVQQNMLTNPNAYDFYVLSEPSLLFLENQFAKQDIPFHVILDFQKSFASLHPGTAIPAAGLFISDRVFESHPNQTKKWIESRLFCVNEVAGGGDAFLNQMRSFVSGGGDLKSRFGFPNLETVEELQSKGKNRLHYLKKDQSESSSVKEITNRFRTALNEEPFSSDCFLTD